MTKNKDCIIYREPWSITYYTFIWKYHVHLTVHCWITAITHFTSPYQNLFYNFNVILPRHPVEKVQFFKHNSQYRYFSHVHTIFSQTSVQQFRQELSAISRISHVLFRSQDDISSFVLRVVPDMKKKKNKKKKQRYNDPRVSTRRVSIPSDSRRRNNRSWFSERSSCYRLKHPSETAMTFSRTS